MTTIASVVAEANHLASLIEAAARGLKHRRHQATLGPVRARLKGLFADYFRRQGEAILAEVEPHIKAALWGQPPPIREAARNGGKRFAQNLIPTSLQPLRFAVTDGEEADWQKAITDAIVGAGKTIAAELKAKGRALAEDVPSGYLREHSLTKLTGGFADTTVERLRGAVADAWDAGGSYDQIVGAIKGTMDDFSDTRAGLIAQTEGNDAYSFGRRQMADEMGMTEKAWDPDGECCADICQPNVDAGWIDIDEDFPSGDSEPTAHPGCDCGVNYRQTIGEGS